MDERTHLNPPEPSRSEAQLRLLIETGLLLSSERSLDVIVQAALDAGLKLCGAAFGAFFYNKVHASGEVYPLYKVAGVPEEAFRIFPMPRPTEVFTPSFEGRAILRSDDITADPRYGKNAPYKGMPLGHLPVRSYLSVPVKTASGEVLGALLYGHPELGQFEASCEDLVATVAAQAAIAMENARLTDNVTRQIGLADQARQAERETSERLAQVFEATTDGILLVDRQWTITFLNQAAATVISSGRSLAGANFWDAFPATVGTGFQSAYERVMRTGEHIEFTEFYGPLKLWVAVRVFPTPEGIAIFFQDVTARKAEQAVGAANTARLRLALDAGQLGTWTWDRATDTADFDERGARCFGVPAHLPVSRNLLRSLIVSEDRPGTSQELVEILTQGGTYTAEYRVKEGAGTRWLAVSGIATFQPGTRELIGMIGTVQDVTARKGQEAALRQSEKLAATGRLAATIAHEINNPLEAVTNLIFLCKTDPTTPGPIQRLLDTADNELARVALIAQQTLGFYRDTTRPTEIDVAALIASVVDLFSRKLMAKKLVCTLDLAQDLRIVGLMGEIKQVFSNLLVNAIDASDANSIITIRGKNAAQRGSPGVAVLVSDHGTGIPPEVRDRMFSPFFTTKQSTGTGLGLWVTRGIVEKQGGRIGFRSCTERTPTGTVFRVFLPKEVQTIDAFGAPRTEILQ